MFHWNLLDILCIQFLCTWYWTQHINHRIASEMTLVFWAAEYHFSWPHEGWPGALMVRCEKRWLILLESWTTKVTGPRVFITLSLNCTMALLLSLQMEAGRMGDIVQWAKLCKLSKVTKPVLCWWVIACYYLEPLVLWATNRTYCIHNSWTVTAFSYMT